jgi:sugar O-acyltransferase (sialic acid O-acetyltransferase NeuD family)
MKKKQIFIYGAGGLGREILSLIRSLDQWEPVGFIDDDFKNYDTVEGLKVFGYDRLLNEKEALNVVLAFGNPAHRKQVFERIKNHKLNFPVLIHPSAILQNPQSISLGAGSVVCAGCVLTTNITIGMHVLVNLKNTIGHDTHIGDFSSLMPGGNIAGEVIIGECVLIGSGANLINRIHIGDACIVGMGAVVLHSVEKGKTVAGVPAKEIRK